MDSAAQDGNAVPVLLLPALPLFWRVALINGLVFLVGMIALVASPATVSSEPTGTEIAVLGVGVAVIAAVNGLLLRRLLVPLDRLRTAMLETDLLQPGQRLPVWGNPTVRPLLAGFNAMLDRLEAERRASSEASFVAQEAERERVARELHDEIGQELTAILLALRRVSRTAPAELATELRTVQDAARTALDDVRQVARRLRPDVLDDLGLASALRGLASDITARGGLPVLRRIEGDVAPLPRQAELVVYRVAQESLTNVVRHADASTAELTLHQQDGAVLLEVSDDGVGMRHQEEGLGIRGMRERALFIGASLSIGARQDGGTAVRLTVPLS